MDIGISLGTASDVAKSAADLVLLDDNFETISLAIDEGRRILSNIRKSFVYLMSSSMDEVFVIGGSLIAGIPFPLSALQIIWVNLFTGSLPALAFAFDDYLDKEKYSGKNLNLIFSKEVKVLSFGVGIISSLILFLLFYILLKIGVELALARSIFFVCFSSYILFIAFSFRSLYRPIFSYKVFGNRALNLSVLVALAILVFTIATPFMRDIFGLAPLPLKWLPFIFLWIAFNILLVEGTKYVLHKTTRFLPKIFSHKNSGK
jgi:Ca2+-transporting ATPase